jgi:hypothetical protein
MSVAVRQLAERLEIPKSYDDRIRKHEQVREQIIGLARS